MPQTSYAYAVARVRALENKLLSHERIDRMVEAPSMEDVLKVLAESEYGQGQEIVDPHDYELLLSAELEKTYQLIQAITPDPEATNLFLLQYDVHNIKVLLKARFLGTPQDELLVGMGTLPLEGLKNAVANKDYRMLPPFLKETLDSLENDLSLRVDPQKIDIALDRALYHWIHAVCSKRRNSFLEKYFVKQVDLINIKSLLRVRKMGEDFDFLKELLLPHGRLEMSFFSRAMEETLEQLLDRTQYGDYGRVLSEGIQAYIKHGNLTVYERFMDNELLDYVRSRKSNPFGLEAVIGYLLAKENELKLVRMILVGKANNIPSDRIRERLRDVYV